MCSNLLTFLCFTLSLTAIQSADSVRRLKYNHPPLREHYEPIPVAIVFDGSPTKETKEVSSTEKTITTFHPRLRSLKLSTVAVIAETEEDITTTAVPTTIATEVTATTTEATTTTTEATTLRAVTVPVSRKQVVQEQHIPVSVVYDDPKDRTRTSGGRNYSPITRNHRRRRPNQNIQENKPVEVSTRNVVTTTARITTKMPVTTEKVKEIVKENIDKIQQKVIKSRFSSGTGEENVGQNAQRVKDPVVPIVNSENHVYGDRGDFNYRYESGDGTVAFESGVLKTTNQNQTGEAVSGGFSYTDKEGKSISLSYTADENGYRPVGDHLPTPPPIPAAIARALRYLATKPTPTEDDVTESL